MNPRDYAPMVVRPTSTNGTYSLIVVDCNHCQQPDTIELLDHARESEQHRGVLEAHSLLVNTHHEDTGHNLTFKHEGGTRREIIIKARNYAKQVDGVPSDVFSDYTLEEAPR